MTKRKDMEEQEEQFEETTTPQSEDVVSPLVMASVVGQVRDQAGNSWGFAVLQFSLYVPSGQVPIDLTTGLRIQNPAPVVCDAAGSFSTTLQQTDQIVPGALWQLTIYPFNNDISGQVLAPFPVIGATALSTQIQDQLKPQVDPPFILPMSHSGPTGQSTLNGSIYFDVEAQKLMVMNPATGTYVAFTPA